MRPTLHPHLAGVLAASLLLGCNTNVEVRLPAGLLGAQPSPAAPAGSAPQDGAAGTLQAEPRQDAPQRSRPGGNDTTSEEAPRPTEGKLGRPEGEVAQRPLPGRPEEAQEDAPPRENDDHAPAPAAYTVTTLAGSSAGHADGPGAGARFNWPRRLTLRPDGTLIVAEMGYVPELGKDTGYLRQVSPEGEVSTLAVPGGFGTRVNATALGPGGDIFFAETPDGGLHLHRLAPDGRVARVRLIGPMQPVDGADVLTETGDRVEGCLDCPFGLGAFAEAGGLVVAPDGTIFASDMRQHFIRKIAPGGEVTTVAGSSEGNADGPREAAQFRIPGGLALGPDGTLYVADEFNHRIRKVTPDGVVTTLAGSEQGFAEGRGKAARFSNPSDLVVAPDGTVFVADDQNHRIRAITPDGVVSTVAGSTAGERDGNGATAMFNGPEGLALGPDGTLYVADTGNHRIRVLRPTKPAEKPGEPVPAS